MNTLHAKMHRVFDGLPWIVLWIYAFREGSPWIGAAAVLGFSRGFLVGWEYPPPTVEELERRAAERVREKDAKGART